MRAIIFDGKELKYREDYPTPKPGPGEALIKVSYAGICATDLEITKGYMGFTGVLGHEFTGVIEDAADDRFWGKRVVGEINLPCGKCKSCRDRLFTHCQQRKVLGISGKDGVFAEYVTMPFRSLHPLPDSIPDEDAVFIEPLAAAYEILEQVKINEFKSVCVLGDGRLGLLVSKVMATTDCVLVTIGRSEEKLSILKKTGINARTSIEGLGRDYDFVIDCTGSESGFSDALKLVKPRGTIILKTTVAERKGADLNRVVIDEITVLGSRCGPFKPAIEALQEKSIDVNPLISKVFPLSEGIEAMRYVAEPGVLKVLLKAD